MASLGSGHGLLRPLRPRLKPGHKIKDAMAQPPTTQSKSQREPPPSLFLHPSPAASHVSLPGILAPGASVPGPSPLTRDRATLDPNAANLGATHRPNRGLKSAESTRSTDRTDALWAEMQTTLEEVELSASGGTHVFGPEHDRKLRDLRAAQIALAQAWARSEADDAIETAYRYHAGSAAGDEVRSMKGAMGEPSKSGAVEGAEAVKSSVPSTSANVESNTAGVDRLGAKLEEETEADILLARKRREANDQYFQRVNNGVIDVVLKLDEVAKAMRDVEQESRDVWNENDTMSASAKS